MIFKLLGAGGQCLISAGTEGQQSLFSCDSAMAVSESPLSLAVSIPSRGELIDIVSRTHEFVLAIPPAQVAEKVSKIALRAQKGRGFVDLFSESGLTAGRAQKIGAPTVEEADVNLECRVISIVSCGDRSLVVGEIVHMGIRAEKDEKAKPVQN